MSGHRGRQRVNIIRVHVVDFDFLILKGFISKVKIFYNKEILHHSGVNLQTSIIYEIKVK